MVQLEGNMSLKNPVTPPGIDPGTVRLVAQCLNHYATPGPIILKFITLIIFGDDTSYEVPHEMHYLRSMKVILNILTTAAKQIVFHKIVGARTASITFS
jgi:hypothetical protein